MKCCQLEVRQQKTKAQQSLFQCTENIRSKCWVRKRYFYLKVWNRFEVSFLFPSQKQDQSLQPTQEWPNQKRVKFRNRNPLKFPPKFLPRLHHPITSSNPHVENRFPPFTFWLAASATRNQISCLKLPSSDFFFFPPLGMRVRCKIFIYHLFHRSYVSGAGV